MNYYYDILINLNETKPIDFYEWMDTDPIEHVKKIPIVRVKTRVIKDFLTHNIRISNDLLDKIFLKTEIFGDKSIKNIDYMILLTDTKCALVVEMNNKGDVICLSKLLLKEELNLLEIAYAFDEEELVYTKLSKKELKKELRIESQVRKFLLLEIKTLFEKKDNLKLKYIYYEWTNLIEKDEKIIYQELGKLIKSNFSNKHYEIYKLIKLSYQLEK